MNWLQSVVFATSYIAAASPITITQIQGPAFQSSLNGRTVQNLTGVVTAKVCIFVSLVYLRGFHRITGFQRVLPRW